LKKFKPCFNAECSKLLEHKKQAKLQWIQNPSEINGNNLNDARREASTYFRNGKKEEISERKINELMMNTITRTFVVTVVVTFKYLGETVTNQNLIQEEIKRRLDSGNDCYHSVQNLLSFRLLLKNVKIRMCKTIILPVVLNGSGTWSLALREEHRLRVFENRVPRKIFLRKRDEVTGGWRKLYNEELRDLYSLPSIMRIMKSRNMRWVGHVARMGRR
jgi:hypothetical protein